MCPRGVARAYFWAAASTCAPTPHRPRGLFGHLLASTLSARATGRSSVRHRTSSIPESCFRPSHGAHDIRGVWAAPRVGVSRYCCAIDEASLRSGAAAADPVAHEHAAMSRLAYRCTGVASRPSKTDAGSYPHSVTAMHFTDPSKRLLGSPDRALAEESQSLVDLLRRCAFQKRHVGVRAALQFGGDAHGMVSGVGLFNLGDGIGK